MVLEIKVPHGDILEDLKPLLPIFLSYLLSFIYIGIYWNNHHHLIQVVHKVNGAVLWSNIIYYSGYRLCHLRGWAKTILASGR